MCDEFDVLLVKGYELEYKEAKKKYELVLEQNVVLALKKKKDTFSDRYVYAYDDIAKIFDIPKSKVQRIAEKNNLKRRN